MRKRRNAIAGAPTGVLSVPLAVVLAGASVLMLAGCVQSTPHVIPTSEPSSKPVFASNAEALAAAKKAYTAYLAVSDQILIDGGYDSGRLLKVATASELRSQQPGFNAARSKHWRSSGATKIDAIMLQSFDPSAPQGRAVVTVYACVDVSDVDVVDQNGNSVVSAGRPKSATFQATFDLASRDPARLIMADELPWQGKGICPE
jgi:hypothetical protein